MVFFDFFNSFCIFSYFCAYLVSFWNLFLHVYRILILNITNDKLCRRFFTSSLFLSRMGWRGFHDKRNGRILKNLKSKTFFFAKKEQKKVCCIQQANYIFLSMKNKASRSKNVIVFYAEFKLKMYHFFRPRHNRWHI